MGVLQLEVIPIKCTGRNLHSHDIISQAKWAEISRIVRKKNHCLCCGRQFTTAELHAHEVWFFDMERKIQILKCIISVCDKCHKTIHYHFLFSNQKLSNREAFICKANYMEVNLCEEEDFEKDGWLFASVSVVNFLIMGIIDESLSTDWNGMLAWMVVMGMLAFVDICLFIYYERNILKKKKLKLATEFQKKNELEQQHYQRLEEVQNEFRSLTHDMNHYLNVLSNMKEEKISGAQHELAEQIQARICETSRSVYCMRPVLNAILNEKEIVAREQDIAFEVFVEPGFDVENLDDYSMIGIMSNLIDNAIEAAGKLEEKRWIRIHLFAVNDGKQNFIRIENSMIYEPVKQTRGFFTKKENKKQHGLGLKNVQKLVENNKGILRLQAEEGRFVAEVVF